MNANDRYINEIAKTRLLSDDEERRLAERIKIGDAKALEQLTKANLKFVVSMVHEYRTQGLSEDDLVSEGNIGLMRAAQKFDASKGTRFVVFAAPYVRKSIEEAVREHHLLHPSIKKEQGKTGTKSARSISIDQPLPPGSNNNITLKNILENQNAPYADEQLNASIVRSEVVDYLQHLNAREQNVLLLLFGLGENGQYTMAEVGEMLGLKRERVRQIRNKAIRKLQRRLK